MKRSHENGRQSRDRTLIRWSCAAAVALLACDAGAPEPSTPGAASQTQGAYVASDSTPTGNACVDLAIEYAAALPDALKCDSTEDSCGAERPAVIRLADGTSVTITGLSHCLIPVNPAHTAELDRVLERFGAAGCELGKTPCPFSPGGTAHCQLGSNGLGTCN